MLLGGEGLLAQSVLEQDQGQWAAMADLSLSQSLLVGNSF